MTTRPHFTRSDIVLLLAAAALVLLYVTGASGGFPLDDSWIHQTYARNLGTTGVWAFVPGVASAASTSPLYTVLLAVGYALGIPYPLWTHGLGALALGLTGIVGARLALQLAPNRPRLAWVVGLALVFNWHLVWAAAAGMETALFGLWTLILLWLAQRDATQPRHPRDGLIFGIVAALTTLTRPEGLLLVGLAGLAVAAAGVRQPARLAGWVAAAALGFAVVVMPYTLYNLGLTGGLLPDTAAAKQTEYAPLLALPYLQRVGRMLYPLAAGVLPLLAPGALTFVWRSLSPRQNARFLATFTRLLPVLWAGGIVALYAARLPANYQHGRYVIPAIPALVVVGVVGTAWLLDVSRRRLPARVLTRAVALAAAIVCVAFALVLGRVSYRLDVNLVNEAMVSAAQWVEANVDPDALLAVHDIGAVGYFAPRPILDLAGLVSPEVVPLMGDSDALWSLMQARDVQYLMAFPDQIPGANTSDWRLCRVFMTDETTANAVGGPAMAVYRVAWNGDCSTEL